MAGGSGPAAKQGGGAQTPRKSRDGTERAGDAREHGVEELKARRAERNPAGEAAAPER
jgi:hypothetical protein